MSWFRLNNQKPDYTCLQLQTATSTLPIPIVWGTNKVAPNVLFYANFQSSGGSSGKGGLFQTGSETTYSCDIIMGLSEGPIGGIGEIWRDQSTYTLPDLGLLLFEGDTPQTEWLYLEQTYPNQALAYQGTAYVSAANYQLGDEADVGNHNFEVQGFFAGSGFNEIDANPAEVIYDFLTNPQYGAGFDPAAINMTTLYGPESGGDASLESYCSAMGISLSPCLTSAEQASSILSRWLQLLNCAAYMSQGELNFVPYGDQTISAGDETISVIATVPNPGATTVNNNDDDIVKVTPIVTICAARAYVSDGGVTYTFTGNSLSYTSSNPPTSAGEYTMSPSGTYIFNPSDEGQSLTITYTYARSVSYVPNLTPIYSLTDLDFVDEKGNKDPVTVSRVDPFSLSNIQRIEVLSRANQYAGTPVEARDQSQIELYGPRVGSTITAHEICDEIFTAPLVVQAILQRGLYVRAHFAFKLSWEYCLLDPMDIVEITDVNLGLTAYPVRIISIEEDDKGLIEITAEELTVGISTPVRYQTDSSRGFLPNRSNPADPVNPPLIYEPPPALTNNISQIWVGASGGENGVVDPNWGGCNVFVSFDGTTYSSTPIATINKKMRQGVLTADLAAAPSGWDTDDTLAIDVAESAAVFSGTSEASAQAGATLALIDNEMLAFETATLTAANAYNLTGLERGLYGSAGAGHSTGAQFFRLDAAIVKYALPTAYVGQSLYFKFQSFNVFGSGVEDLSTCRAYTYSPIGIGANGAIATALTAGASLNLGNASPPTVFENWGNATAPIVLRINLGDAS